MARKHVRFEGLRYCRDEKSGYYLNSTIRKRLHRAVWEHFKGAVPEGHDVHHRFANDKHTIDVDRLECMPRGDHHREHWRQDDGTKLAQARKNIAAAGEAARTWHGTPEGLKWHAQHARDQHAARQPVAKVCEQCKANFLDRSVCLGARFCSNNCKSKARRASGVDDEERFCIVCARKFTINRYQERKFCTKHWRATCNQGGRAK